MTNARIPDAQPGSSSPAGATSDLDGRRVPTAGGTRWLLLLGALSFALTACGGPIRAARVDRTVAIRHPEVAIARLHHAMVEVRRPAPGMRIR